MVGTFWAFAPALVAIVLALLTKQVYISLFVGILTGALMYTGGNCGAQVSTLMIRGLALGELDFKDILKILWKEFRVGAMIGAVLSVFTFLRVLFINQASAGVSLVVASALFCTVILAKIIGCCLPLLAKRFKLDPAMMASPLITTIVDAAALALYFSIAKVVLF